MAMFDPWHRRWLRRQLERSGVVDGDDVAFSGSSDFSGV